MAQKPIDKRHPLETRDAVWEAIRKAKGYFTARDIYKETRCSLYSVKEYLTALLNAGYLNVFDAEAAGQAADTSKRYLLSRDCGVEAPRVRKDGTELTQGRSREQMWQIMRALGEFSALELAVNATTEQVAVAETEAKNYIYHLHKAGYLVMVKDGKPGGRSRSGELSRYRLIPSRYSGPKPPMVQRVKQVYDPNLKKVVWSSGGDE
jgi:hypothetical protein